MYEQYLHRQADTGGRDAFVALLQSEKRDEAVRALLLSSDEYFARA